MENDFGFPPPLGLSIPPGGVTESYGNCRLKFGHLCQTDFQGSCPILRPHRSSMSPHCVVSFPVCNSGFVVVIIMASSVGISGSILGCGCAFPNES